MKIPALLLLFAVSLAVGCSRSSPTPAYDSKKAQEVLFQALNAWKQNRVAALAKGDLPLRFEDEDYRAGYRLIDFRLEDDQLLPRSSVDVRVKLFLLDLRGHSSQKTVTYQITLEPTLAVLRND